MTGTFLTLAVLHNVATAQFFCEGKRAYDGDKYPHFLHEYSLDMDSQKKLAANQDILKEAKLRAYFQQAPNVKKGQKALCGKDSGWDF